MRADLTGEKRTALLALHDLDAGGPVPSAAAPIDPETDPGGQEQDARDRDDELERAWLAHGPGSLEWADDDPDACVPTPETPETVAGLDWVSHGLGWRLAPLDCAADGTDVVLVWHTAMGRWSYGRISQPEMGPLVVLTRSDDRTRPPFREVRRLVHVGDGWAFSRATGAWVRRSGHRIENADTRCGTELRLRAPNGTPLAIIPLRRVGDQERIDWLAVEVRIRQERIEARPARRKVG